MPLATYEEIAIGTAATNAQYPPQDPDEVEWQDPPSRANGQGIPVKDGYPKVVWRWPRAEECLVEFMADYWNAASKMVYLWTRHRDGGRPTLVSAIFFDWTARRATPAFWEAIATFIRVVEV